LGLFGQTQVTARPDGTVLVVPGPMSTYPAVYREVGPWVWQEVGGGRTISMRTAGDRVDAIGFESAFTLLRTRPDRDGAVVLPVLIASTAVLVLGLLAWPAGAIVRRRYRVPAFPHPSRPARVLTRIAACAAVLGLAGWTVVITMIMGDQEVPDTLIRTAQVAQWAGVVGMLPAAFLVITSVRHRTGPIRIAGSVCLLLALAGTAWFAQAFGLLSPDVSY
jgi:hypothetical protein